MYNNDNQISIDMKDDVQHNDFIGTSAADISDFESLNDSIKTKGIDAKNQNKLQNPNPFYAY